MCEGGSVTDPVFQGDIIGGRGNFLSLGLIPFTLMRRERKWTPRPANKDISRKDLTSDGGFLFTFVWEPKGSAAGAHQSEEEVPPSGSGLVFMGLPVGARGQRPP